MTKISFRGSQCLGQNIDKKHSDWIYPNIIHFRNLFID